MAPMEGITNYLYRQAFQRHFGGIDRFYTPFLSPNQHDSFQTKEWNEILPEHNRGLAVIPQILTKVPEHFLWAANECAQRGYDEVNLNTGCPSGTVVAKGKGSGMLRDTAELNRFLETVFASCPVGISIKSRIGINDPGEFESILAVYNQYPIRRLILHPRVTKEFYKGDVHREVFALAYEQAKMPLVFNGNLFDPEDIQTVPESFPNIEGLMLGRGLLSRPSLAREIKNETPILTMAKFAAFHEDLMRENAAILHGDHQVLHRMKEFWPYWYIQFSNGEKYWKKIRKARTLAEYRQTAEQLFETEMLNRQAYFSHYSIR